MLKKALMLTCLIVISCAGCAMQNLDTKAELLFAQKVFLRTVNSLTLLREAEKFDDGEIDSIKVLINSGDSILDQWTDAVLEGKEAPGIVDAFDIVLQELIDYRKRGEKDGQ